MRRGLLLLAAAVLGVIPAVALAESGGAPRDLQYGNPVTNTTTVGETETQIDTTVPGQGPQGGVQGEVASGGPLGGEAEGGVLPFTGLEAGLVVAAGAGLAALGLALRRLARRRG